MSQRARRVSDSLPSMTHHRPAPPAHRRPAPPTHRRPAPTTHRRPAPTTHRRPAPTTHRLSTWLGSCLLALCALPLCATETEAGSALVLQAPGLYGIVPATTYSTEGKRLGGADISVERGEDGRVTMRAATATDDGARTEVEAVLEVIDATGSKLRLLSQKSESFDAAGKSFGVLFVDHEKATGSCTPREAGAETKTLALPDHDRIVNIPLNLLFLPIVERKVDVIDFQVFLCRDGPQLMDFKTETERRGDVVEVRYKPQLGMMLSWIAESFIPNLAFWFDVNQEGLYIAHRMPLYPQGPEVVVVRDGLSPAHLHSLLAAAP